MTLPKYLYDPDNYVEVLGNFNKIGSAAVIAASRVYLSEGGGALLPATYPGLVIAHNCYWLPLFHAWLVDDITKPATILISGFNGAQSTLWIDPSTAFFGIWNDSMWQVYPPTGAQILSMPGAGSFHASGNYDWAFPRLVTKEIPLHSLITRETGRIAIVDGGIAPYFGRPTTPLNPPGPDLPLPLCIGWWPFTMPQDSALLAASVMLEYYPLVPAAANVTFVTVGTIGNNFFGNDRNWTPPFVDPTYGPFVAGSPGAPEYSVPGFNILTTDHVQVITTLAPLFVDNTQTEYFVTVIHSIVPATTFPIISGIRIVYLELGVRTPM